MRPWLRKPAHEETCTTATIYAQLTKAVSLYEAGANVGRNAHIRPGTLPLYSIQTHAGLQEVVA
jgi:hypothetical protein